MKRFEGLEAHRLTAGALYLYSSIFNCPCRYIGLMLTGIFVNEILTHMQQKEEGNQDLDKKKFFIYSAVCQCRSDTYEVYSSVWLVFAVSA